MFAAAAAFGPWLAAAERPLDLDPAHSTVEVAVRASLHSFTARLTTFETVLVADDTGRIRHGRVAFHFRDLLTGRADRDRRMHAWQETPAHPDGAFELVALEPAAPGSFVAVGRLTLHGVTRDLRFPVAISHDGPLCAIDGDAPVDTREFGLPIIAMFGVLKVDPVVHVRFHLQARRSA
jgi:polyisoprenoid-binding protein YceI